jgi:hypothetical protein
VKGPLRTHTEKAKGWKKISYANGNQIKAAIDKLSVVVHACNPSTQEDHKSQASLGYIAKPCLKRLKEPGVSGKHL